MKLEFGKKFLIKSQMTKTCQDDNGIDINFLKYFYEYLTDMMDLQYQIRIWKKKVLIKSQMTKTSIHSLF